MMYTKKQRSMEFICYSYGGDNMDKRLRLINKITMIMITFVCFGEIVSYFFLYAIKQIPFKAVVAVPVCSVLVAIINLIF